MHSLWLDNDLQQPEPCGEGGGVSQPEAKSRAELRPEPSVPDTLGGNQCSQCLTLDNRLGPQTQATGERTDLELVRVSE